MNQVGFPDIKFTDPVLVLTVLLSIILLAPILFKKLNIPDIIGLIVSGIIIGPYGLDLVEFGDSIKLLSSAGLLYLMFLAGLDLNTRDVLRYKNKSITFGALTFFIPLILGFITAHFFLSYGILASLLIASMFSTHTLISYPIASRLGITRSEAVTITIGGTIITDTAVLLLLAFISAATKGSLDILFWIKMIVSLSIFSFLILWGAPKISTWFFKNMEGESGSQYVFVLTILFISGVLAKLAGIEPIIGAFLAGLSLSGLIPKTSALHNRITFIGNNFFIPIFLISVGLMVDLSVFFKGTSALIVAGSLIMVAIASKYLAARVMQVLYKFSLAEKNVLFGMSVSHAAAIIAVVIVGYDLKLIGLDMLNGAIMIILISCLLGSIVTEWAGRKLAIAESKKAPLISKAHERIMVPVANPATIEGLIDFSILISQKPSQPIYMLSVVPDNEFAQENILKNNKMFESAITHAAASDRKLSLIARVDINIANGISRAAKELMINKIVLGWNGKSTTTNFFFGSIIDKLIADSQQMITVVKTIRPLNTLTRLVVCMPRFAEFESGFKMAIKTIQSLAMRNSAGLVFCGTADSTKAVEDFFLSQNDTQKIEYIQSASTHPIAEHAGLITESDLYVVIAARYNTMSHQHYLEHMPRDLVRYHENHNFIIIYPQQKGNEEDTSLSTMVDLNEEPTPTGRFDSIKQKRKPAETRHNSPAE